MDETSQQLSALYARYPQESKEKFVASLFMIAATTTGEPCWCGSRKLFEQCHLDRQRQRKITDSEIRSNVSRIMDANQYCCATFDAANCGTFIKGAHTIQRGRVLQSMAKDGHVGSFYRNIGGFSNIGDIKNGVKRQASIFYGFCDYHDTELFKNFEVSEFTVSQENCWASSYRAICHEYYQKHAAKSAVLWQKEQCDRGYALYEQLLLQEQLAVLERDIHKGFTDIHVIKQKCEALKTNNQLDQLTSYIIQLDKPLDIAVCSTMSPYVDINGVQIQNLGDPDIHFQHFFISTVTMQGNATYVISHLNEHTIIAAYLRDIFSRGNIFILDWLTKSIFAYSENTYFRLDWWTSIDPVRQQAIYDLAMSENYTTPFDYDDVVSATIGAKVQSIIELK